MIFTTSSPASKELLLGKVSDMDIFLLFCKDFSRFRKPFRSPIILSGETISNKSAVILPATQKGKEMFYDFRIGKTFNPLALTSAVTGLDYRGSIEYLCDKFGITNNQFDQKLLPSRNFDLEKLSKEDPYCKIDVKYSDWTKEHLEYWGSCGWNSEALDKAKIRPIEKFWIERGGDYRSEYYGGKLGPISFTYDFYEVDGIFRRKIYNPKSDRKDLKWKNNTNKQIIQGLNTIDYHVDKLYIVSSMKDCGPYWTLLGKPCAVAPNSESTIMSPSQIRMLRQISDEQIIWYDNDHAGRMNALKQANLYGFEMYKWSHHGKPKDQSDYVKERGLKEFRKLIL